MAVSFTSTNTPALLEFDKVLLRLKAYCVGTPAAALCAAIVPETQLRAIRDELQRAGEAQQVIAAGETFLPHGYEDITTPLKNLEIEGYILDAEDILAIRRLLNLTTEVRRYFRTDRIQAYPGLAELAVQLFDPSRQCEAIDKVFDPAGNVRADASPELVRIAREIQTVTRQCDSVFQKLVRMYASKNWLADTLESVRNDRRVLAVKAEFKRQIRGILHDHSASGKTVLIEPEEVIAINNDLFDLHGAYKMEIRRLLRALCDALRHAVTHLRDAQLTITLLDLYHAKGRLATAMHAHVPRIEDTPRLCMYQARHPLLLLKNLPAAKPVVPFDLDLQAPNRILLVSGPNAGGKSILMKAVGLLQMMVQAGFPVPVAPESVFGVFSRIGVSLGDHQSIDNDLSTYSSKLMEMEACLRLADERSLVLIDEFGSGTDPRIGGAIAEGILDALFDKGVYGVITTHYSELKVYAYHKRGILNGAMIFDKEQMAPTYRLRVGKPGSSFAFEIARKSGLPAGVIDYAMRRSGQNLRAMEELLSDLEQQKHHLESELQQVKARSKQLDQLVQSYERLQHELTAQRHRMRLEQKERDYQHLSQLQRELEKSVKAIREEKNAEAAKETLRDIKSKQADIREEIREIHTDLRARSDAGKKELHAGDFVRMHDGSQTGRIERVNGQKATVIVGQLRMEVPLQDLVWARDPLQLNPERSVQSDVEKQAQFNPRLDVRGMRPTEALEMLERFLDMALVSGAHSVEIIHGKGTGALRKMVHGKLRDYPVKDIAQPVDAQGGSGMTVVTF